MQFVDTVTPSSPSTYFGSMKEITPSKYWNKTTSQAAADWAAMYYQNAYNTAMANYQNEYNSPLQQMLRYQEAGINPFLAATEPGNMGGSLAAAAPRGSASGVPTGPEVMSSVNQSVNSINQTLKTAQGLYDYLQYGRPLNESELAIQQNNALAARWQADLAQYRALGEEAEAAWKIYWNTGQGGEWKDDGNYLIQDSPRSVYMQSSTDRINAQIEQLKSLVDVLYPSQAAANKAREALTSYQKSVMEGQNEAILHLDTGNPERDAILKQVLFWLQNRLQVRI